MDVPRPGDDAADPPEVDQNRSMGPELPATPHFAATASARGAAVLLGGANFSGSLEWAHKYFRIMAATAESHARNPLSEPQFEAARNAAFLAGAIQMSAYHIVLLPVWVSARPSAQER